MSRIIYLQVAILDSRLHSVSQSNYCGTAREKVTAVQTWTWLLLD